jgi:hypothetical protein
VLGAGQLVRTAAQLLAKAEGGRMPYTSRAGTPTAAQAHEQRVQVGALAAQVAGFQHGLDVAFAAALDGGSRQALATIQS